LRGYKAILTKERSWVRKISQVRGKANDVIGAVTGNTGQQIKGKMQKVAGKVQEEVGKATSGKSKPANK
jgi:uncharacterized protein YjbJ (UPF0337 family)